MKKRNNLKKKRNSNGFQKIASFTSSSISSVYEGYKKSQKAKRLEYARLEKVSQKKNSN